jgi:nicotinamidase-related amidase
MRRVMSRVTQPRKDEFESSNIAFYLSSMIFSEYRLPLFGSVL